MFVTRLLLALLLALSPRAYAADVSKGDGTQATQYQDYVPGTSASTPAVSACGSGPSPSVSGNETRGKITVGGGVVTSCTLTLVSTPNSCYAFGSGVTAIIGGSLSSNVFTISTSLTVGGGTITYLCLP